MLYTKRNKLWFDVGIKRYTTCHDIVKTTYSCGLM